MALTYVLRTNTGMALTYVLQVLQYGLLLEYFRRGEHVVSWNSHNVPTYTMSHWELATTNKHSQVKTVNAGRRYSVEVLT